MKILVIRNSWMVAGAELYHIKLSKSFVELKNNCEIVLITNNPVFSKLASDNGIKSYIVDIFGEEVGTKKGIVRLFFILPSYVYYYLLTIKKIRSEVDPDVLVLSGKTEKYILTPLTKLIGLPIVWIEHGQVFTETISKVALYLYRFSSLFCKLIMIESKDAYENLLKNGIKQSLLCYIGSGIDIRYFTKKMNTSYQEELIIGFVATICWEKGIQEFMETIKIVSKSHKKIKFMVVGDGPQLEYAKKFAKNHNLNDLVVFMGRQNNVKDFLEKISIILAPISHLGGISLSTQEAMSMNCVPIVSDFGGNRELVLHENTGFIYKNNFAENASNTILKLYDDRDLLNKISKNARSHIESNYDNYSLANKWRNCLMKVIRSPEQYTY